MPGCDSSAIFRLIYTQFVNVQEKLFVVLGQKVYFRDVLELRFVDKISSRMISKAKTKEEYNHSFQPHLFHQGYERTKFPAIDSRAKVGQEFYNEIFGADIVLLRNSIKLSNPSRAGEGERERQVR